MNVPASRLHEFKGEQIDYRGALKGTLADVDTDGVTVSIELAEDPGFWLHLPAHEWVKIK